MVMEDVTTARRGASHLHRGLRLTAALAAGALLTSCAAGAVDSGSGDSEPAPAEQANGAVHAADGQSRAGDRTAGQAGDDAEGDAAEGEASGGLPEGWAGTISATSLPASSGTQYLVMQYLHGEDQERTEMEASRIEGMEFFGGQDVDCEGTASVDGDAAACVLRGEDGVPDGLPIEVRMVPVAFGNSALLYSADAEGLTDLPIAPDTVLGLGSLHDVPLEDVTDADAETALLNAVMLADAPDGELPEGLELDCTVQDGGVHAACEVTGTPGAGGDGIWYATAQPGYDGNDYLFSKLPA